MTENNKRKRFEALEKRIEFFRILNLKLDLSRGKPSPEQLDISNSMLELPLYDSSSEFNEIRNYGNLQGLEVARQLFSELLDVSSKNIIVGGNSSLTMEYETLVSFMLFGTVTNKKPWRKYRKVKFICPVPGYDRHFAMCEQLGISMVNVPMLEDGPDMDMVEKLVKEDASIVGMWCVPKYSNPTGAVYSSATIDRLAKMETKNSDFTILCDNAYSVHDFYRFEKVKSLVKACKKYGNPNRAIAYTSLSKVTHAGASVAALGSSKENIEYMLGIMSAYSISFDKVNQYRHTKYLKNLANIKEHMKKHRDILLPKFEKTLEILETNLGGKNIATWTKPKGGYFISFDLNGVSAKETVEMCRKLGVKLTPAGAAFPYGKDPNDCNIRLAPSFANLEQINLAMGVLTAVAEYLSLRNDLKK